MWHFVTQKMLAKFVNILMDGKIDRDRLVYMAGIRSGLGNPL